MTRHCSLFSMTKGFHPLQGGYNGYNDYRQGYGAQNYSGSGMGDGGAYRGGRGAGDGGQMNNQNNPLWAAQGYPVTGPGGSVSQPVAVLAVMPSLHLVEGCDMMTVYAQRSSRVAGASLTVTGWCLMLSQLHRYIGSPICAAGGHSIEPLTAVRRTITMAALEKQHGISLQAGDHSMPD